MLDIRTIFIAAALATTLMAGVFAIVSMQDLRRRNFGAMIISQMLAVIGFILISLRGTISDLISISLASTLLFAACAMIFVTIRKLRDQAWYPQRLIVVVGCYAAVVFALVLSQQPITTRAPFTSGGLALFLLFDAWSIIRSTRHTDRAVNIIAAIGIGTAGVLLLWQVIMIELAGDNAASIVTDRPPQMALAIVVFCASIISTIGLLMMHWNRAEFDLYLQSTRDSLTGILNRRAILARAQRDHLLHQRSGLPFCVLLIDLDHFKIVNDTYGHQAGDDVLIQFADLLTQVHRRPDLLARYGGEEFIILLPQTNEFGATILATRLMKALHATTFISGEHRIKQNISIGIAEWSPAHAASMEVLISQADKALYLAKARGRDRFEVFVGSPEIVTSATSATVATPAASPP